MTRRTAALVLVPALLAALAACSDPAEEPTGLATSPTVSEPTADPTTPSSTPTHAPTTEPEPTDQPYEITFDVPDGLEVVIPDDVVAGTPEAQALDVYLRYEVATWSALTTNQIPDDLPDVSIGSALTDIEDRVANQTTEDFRLTGDLTITPVVEAANDTAAVITGCVDQSEVMVIDAGAEREPEGVSPTYTFQASLHPGMGDELVVGSYDIEETAC